MNIDSYISGYSGATVFARLRHIANVTQSSEQRLQAIRALISSLKSSNNTMLYAEICSEMGDSLGPEYAVDQMWLEETERKNERTLEQLDSDVQASKASLIKEHIRGAFMRLGDFLLSLGRPDEAQKQFARMRDHCGTADHSAQMCVKNVIAYLDMQRYDGASIHVARGEQRDGTDALLQAKLIAIGGVLSMRAGDYRGATRRLTDLPAFLGDHFSEALTAKDVARYAALCALTTLDRASLKGFGSIGRMKQYLEVDPQMRILVKNFSSGQFVKLFADLAAMRKESLMDLHLGAKFDDIVGRIKERVVVQYFQPYENARLENLVKATGLPHEEALSLVSHLVATGRIPARIDAQTGILSRVKIDERQLLMREVLALTHKHSKEMKSAVLRLSAMQQGLFVGKECIHNFHSSTSGDTAEAAESSYGSPQSSQHAQLRKGVRSRLGLTPTGGLSAGSQKRSASEACSTPGISSSSPVQSAPTPQDPMETDRGSYSKYDEGKDDVEVMSDDDM